MGKYPQWNSSTPSRGERKYSVSLHATAETGDKHQPDRPLSSNAGFTHQRNLVDSRHSTVIDLQHFAYYFLLGSCILRKKNMKRFLEENIMLR